MIRDSDNLRVQGDEVPPPPYSETDIYSNSGGGPRSPDPFHASHDDAASRVSSSSTGGDILTPPETPRTSSNAQFPLQEPPTAGAAQYFETRPPPASAATSPRDSLVVNIKVEQTSLPDDFPYRDCWAARDVNAQDWATFVNFLLPDHTTRGNEAVIERKLREEGQSDSGVSVGLRSQAEAQLGHVRDGQGNSTRSRRMVETTVQQWNDGFFSPRAIRVKLEPEANLNMPGGFPSHIDDADARQRQQEAREQQPRAPATLGRLIMDRNGIRFGDSIVLDSKGIKIKGLVMDRDGISISRNTGPAESPDDTRSGPSSGGGSHHPSQGPSPHPGRPSWPFGGEAPPGWPWSQRGRSPDGHDRPRSRSHHTRRSWHQTQARGSEERGRRGEAHRDERHHRASSVSSESSVSSSSSESSMGSLPDYDDVKDHQLPLYAARLQDWTSNPHQIRTRADVEALQRELRAAEAAPAQTSSTPASQNLDRTALKAQIRALRSECRSMKKAQRRARKAEKRLRRLRRRLGKEQRRQRHQTQRGPRNENQRGCRGAPAGLHAPFGVHAPVPAVPHHHTAPPLAPPQSSPTIPPFSWRPRVNVPFSPGSGSGRCSFAYSGPVCVGTTFRNDIRPWRGFGFGFGGGGSGDPRDAPGAWPEDKARAREEATGAPPPPVPAPGAASAAKYKSAEQIEQQLEHVTAQMAGARVAQERTALETATKALTKTINKLRMEADEAYARELASHEAGHQ